MRGVVAEGDKTESQVVRSEIPAETEILTDLINVVSYLVDVGLLAACNILNEHNITGKAASASAV